jgi:hypothetical protein
MRNWKAGFVNDAPLQSAKREWHAIRTSRPTLAGILAVGVVAGLAGPFGTLEHLTLLPRIAYWLGLSAVTYVTGSLLVAGLTAGWLGRALPRLPAVLAAGALAGLAVAAEVALLNRAVFGLALTDTRYLAMLALNGAAIAMVIAGLSHYLAPAQADPAPDHAPPLLDRLPFDRRGALVALSVQDHYVEVATTRGQALLLMRLSDAIRETAPTEGLQVHRSHWVATGQVRAARRERARAVLTMSDGRDIPVSRSNIPAVKEAGLLPG